MNLKVIYNKFIPFKGFYAMSLFNLILVREDCRKYDNTYIYKKMINHESIHFEQQKELGFVFFYLLYGLEWIIKLFFFGSKSYNHISFEQEAYNNERDYSYIKTRKKYSWLKYIFI
jgi:hypothetical protein